MSFRLRVRDLIDVLLRVPPLFLIDELLRIGLGIPFQTEHELDPQNDNSTFQDFSAGDVEISGPSYDAEFYTFLVITILKFTASCTGKF